MRSGGESNVAVTMLVAGLVTCLAGCVPDYKVLEQRYGKAGPPKVARPRGGIRRAPAHAVAVDPRADYAIALSFTCNSWKDKDAAEPLDFPGDFVGLDSERFTTANKVAFGLKTGITRSYKRMFKLWDQTKTLIYEKEKVVQASDTGHVYALQFKPGDLKPGTYEAAWFIDGKEVGSTEIVIVGK